VLGYSTEVVADLVVPFEAGLPIAATVGWQTGFGAAAAG